MGMDAITAAAFESLAKDVLPRLVESCKTLARQPPSTRKATNDLQFLLHECRELLALTLKWSGTADTGMSDVEALTLMLGAEIACDQQKPQKMFHAKSNGLWYAVPISRVQECVRVRANDAKKLVKVCGTEVPILSELALSTQRPTWMKPTTKPKDRDGQHVLKEDSHSHTFGVILRTASGPKCLPARRLIF